MGRSMLLYTAAATLSVTSLVLPVNLVTAAPNPLPTAQWSSSSSPSSWSSSSSNWTPASKSSSWSSSSPSPSAKTWKNDDGEYKDENKDGNKDEKQKEGYNNGGDDAGHYSPQSDESSHNYSNTSTSYMSSSSSTATSSTSSSASSTSTSSASSASTDSSGTQLTAEYLAISLNLTTHWKAPTPPALASTSNNGGGGGGGGPESAAAQGYPFILEKWQLSGDKLNGGQEGNLHFVMDPYMNNSSSSTSDGMANMANSTSSSSSGEMMDPALVEMVLQVDYQKGSYRQGGDHSEGGATFFPFPMEMLGAQRVLLNYEVAFKQDFDWVKGGKLPGIFSGADERSCSGGQQSEEGDCFSVRMMWREGGLGEVYAYLPASNMLCPSNSPGTANNTTSSTASVQQGQSIICNSDYGTSINRGSFNFTLAKYTPVTIYVALNDDETAAENGNATAPANAGNGRIQVWVNQLQVVDLKGLRLTKDGMGNMELADSNPLKIFFSTFFGGSTLDWASKQDTSTYFKNLQVWTDAASSSSSTGSSSNSNSNNNGRDTINGQHKSSQAPPPAAGDDNNDEKSHAQGRYGASLMEKTSVLVVALSYLVAVLAAMYL